MFSIYNGIILSCAFFTCRFIWTAGKKTHVLKVTNFMNNLKNTELLTFAYMFRSFRPGFMTVSTENYRGMAHIIKKQWNRQVVYHDINFANLFLLFVGISSFCLLLSFFLVHLAVFHIFSQSLLPTGLSRRPHVIEWLWFPYICSRYLYMYISFWFNW